MSASVTITVPPSYPVFLQQTTPLRGISVQDPYASATGTPITVTIGDLAGVLSMGEIAGLTLSGFDTRQMTLTGSLDAVNGGLASLQYGLSLVRLPFDQISLAGTDANPLGGTGFALITSRPARPPRPRSPRRPRSRAAMGGRLRSRGWRSPIPRAAAAGRSA